LRARSQAHRRLQSHILQTRCRSWKVARSICATSPCSRSRASKRRSRRSADCGPRFASARSSEAETPTSWAMRSMLSSPQFPKLNWNRRQSTVKATTGVSRLRSNLACSTCSGRGPAEWPLHAPRWPLAPPQRLGIRFDHSRPQVRPHDARAHTRVLLALFVTAKASREMDLKALGCRRFCFHVEPTQPPGDVGQKRRFCTLAEVSV
jgi:hypothetical protein